MILLPCPVRPDLDCIAGAVGYAEYLRKAKKMPAKAWLCGIPDGEAQFYLDTFGDIAFAGDEEIQNVTGYILVDFSSIDFFPEPIPAEKIIEIIDHRFFTEPEKNFKNARIQLDRVGAAATQITEYFIKGNLVPSRSTACLLYGAIYTHTLCCNGSLFTERDATALSWLKNLELNAEEFVSQQLTARKNEILLQFPTILSTEMKIENSLSGKYGISQLEMIEGQNFWHENKETIHSYFQKYGHPVFLNIIDLTTNTSIFYSSEKEIAGLLQNHVTICAQGNRAVHFQPALMRKQIIPLLNNM